MSSPIFVSSCLYTSQVVSVLKKRNTAAISRVLCAVVSFSVPVIYLIRMSPHGFSVLPSIAAKGFGRTTLLTMVYMNLQPPEGTARRSPGGWWSLTPPSHPYSKRYGAVVLFCLILLSPTASIFGSGVSCAARTFLSYTNICVPATSRSSVSECKGTAKEWKNKINCDLFFFHKFCLLSFFFYISVSIGV